MGPLISTVFGTGFPVEKIFFPGPQSSQSIRWFSAVRQLPTALAKNQPHPRNSGDFSKLIFKKEFENKE